MFETTDIIINIDTEYLETQSKPELNEFVFAYTIVIYNSSPESVQLMSRHWMIKDANYKIEEVIGEGVVGEKPVMEPNSGFQYSSGAVLATEVGTMEGFYHFELQNKEKIKIPIPKFVLSVPRQLH